MRIAMATSLLILALNAKAEAPGRSFEQAASEIGAITDALFRRPGDASPRHPEAQARILAWTLNKLAPTTSPIEYCLLWVSYTERDGTHQWALADMYREAGASEWRPLVIFDSPYQGVEFFESAPTFEHAEAFLTRLRTYVGPPMTPNGARPQSVIVRDSWLDLFGVLPQAAKTAAQQGAAADVAQRVSIEVW